MKIFMRDWIEREYSLDEVGYRLDCGHRVDRLVDAIHAKWVEHDGESVVKKEGHVCESCFFMWGCEHGGT